MGAAAALLIGAAVANPAAGATTRPIPFRALRLAHSSHALTAAHHGLARIAQRAALPAGVPTHGTYAFLLRLRAASTFDAYRSHLGVGRAVASSAAKAQFGKIKSAQAEVVRALPAGTRVLFKTHSALAGVAVLANVRNYAALQGIDGVDAVYPIAPKTPSNSYAMPLQHAPQAWQATSDLGANATIAVIDTGVDYTHADLGGGTVSYADAKANDAAPVPSDAYDHAKFDTATGRNGTPVGFYDFAGDDYNADPTDAHFQPVPDPDHNPLDCDGHGTHVSGIAAGYGENPDGSTFTGDYLTLPTDTASYQAQFRIGPGMAPEAKLLAFKVFGCAGSTDLVTEAIDRAIDPNQDGDPSDHVSVINMSLGADYASAQDGDSVEANLASKMGITVVAASGNGGDEYDVGGSPGNAQRVISVANSQDAYSQLDSLHITLDGAPEVFAAQRSANYDWATKPDISGQVVKLSASGNLDGCDPLNATDAAAVNGKIAFLEWTDNDATRRCGSALRSKHVADAGAIGAILGEDEETFAAGIAGSDTIPVVQVVKSAADAIRASLSDNEPNNVTGTTAGDFAQLLDGTNGTPNLNDELNSSSSRGVRGAGDVKPDVTAVGTTVFSAAMGTASQGVSFTGTSMATPMVAGLAALVRSEHSGWTPEEVKADIMNTAGEDLFTGPGHTSRKYAPNRVGAGRIQVDSALANTTLAFVQNDPGAVSVSFGPVAVTKATTLTKTVKVENKSATPAAYGLAYQPITSVPGVSYQVSPSTLTIPGNGTGSFTVKFVVSNPKALTKTHDGTKPSTIDMGGGLLAGTETLADASGRVVLTPTSGATIPLRVPVYSAPRPASRMTQPRTVNLPGSGVQRGSVRLTGTGVNQGSGATRVQSAIAGLELDATSGSAPNCSATVTTLCVHDAAEHAADLKYVGTTSSYPILRALGDPSAFSDATGYISITTQRPWTTPVGPQEFDVWLDTNGDNKPDAVVYNTRLGTSDFFESELLDVTNSDPSKWFVRDDEFINDRVGTDTTMPTSTDSLTLPGVDTALYDSDTMVLPVWVGALGGFSTPDGAVPALPGFSRSHSRIRFGVSTDGESGVVDSVGISNATLGNAVPTLRGAMSMDIARPGVALYGSLDSLPPFPTPLLWRDAPGSLTVRRDVAAYNADHALGALFVHFHNVAGSKAQRVTLKTTPKVALRLSTTSVRVHHAFTATITVSNTAGRTPTGKVYLRRVGGRIVASGRLSGGKVTLRYTPGSTGSFQLRAEYGGDGTYAAGRSAAVRVRVT